MIKARLNLLPTQQVINKIKKSDITNCRNCTCPVETISYILNGCKKREMLQTIRHNNICKIIINKIK